MAWIAGLALPAIAFAAACGGPTDGSAPLIPGDAGRPGRGGDRNAPDEGGVQGDPQVLDFLLVVNEGVIARARIADAKATDPSVRTFAADMAADHGTMADRVREIGKRKAMTRAPSANASDMLEESVGSVEKLGRLEGASFDRNYLQEEIILHLKTMAVLERTIAPATTDPELAAAVIDARDKAVVHREHAQTILRAVRAEAGAPVAESSSDASSDSSTPDDGGPD